MTAATNRRNRRANNRSRRCAGVVWTPRAARQRRAETTTFTYSGPMFLTAVDGPSGRLATYVSDSESKRRRIYEGAAFTTIVWDGGDYLQWCTKRFINPICLWEARNEFLSCGFCCILTQGDVNCVDEEGGHLGPCDYIGGV